jgi:hypothetical protein
VLNTQRLDMLGDLSIQDNMISYNKFSRIDIVFHHLDHLNRLFVSRFGKDDLPELHVIQVDINL